MLISTQKLASIQGGYKESTVSALQAEQSGCCPDRAR